MPAALAYFGPSAGAAETSGKATVTQQAYYTSAISESLPPSITDEVPPGVVCLVAGIGGFPQACGEQVTALKRQLEGTPLDVSGGLPVPDTRDDELPQPVTPGSLPVGMFAGQERYASYLRFELPPVPSDHLVDRFDLVLHEHPSGINAAMESPAFRDAVLTALSTYAERGPGALQRFFENLAGQRTPLVNPEPTGIEACVVIADWTAGDSQDGTTQPERDCIFGSTGQYDPEAGTWTFNLAFALQAWLDGTYPNLGISLKPLGAENLAYGDPDLSTNFMITLGGGGDPTLVPEFTLATSPAPEPITVPDLPTAGGPMPNVDPFVPPASGVLGGGAERPAGGGGAGAPAADDESATPELRPVENVASGGPDSAWYAWLLLPVGVVMALSFGGALSTTPVAATARPGALSALISSRGGPSA